MRLMRRHQTCRPIHAVKHRWSNPYYFTQKHTFEIRGAKAPCLTFRIRERTFHLPRHFRSRDRMFQEAKVPPMVLSLLGAKVRGNESTVTQPSNARDCGQVDARRSTADISPPQSAALDLHPVAQRLLLINRPRRDGTLSWRWYLSLIHIWRCRRIERCRSRWSPYH